MSEQLGLFDRRRRRWGLQDARAHGELRRGSRGQRPRNLATWLPWYDGDWREDLDQGFESLDIYLEAATAGPA